MFKKAKYLPVLLLSALAIGCEKSPDEATVSELPSAATPNTETTVFTETEAQEPPAPATTEEASPAPAEPKAVRDMTEAEKKAAGIATDEDIEAITTAYTPYEFYEQSLKLVEQGTGFAPEQELSETELATFSEEFCQAIEDNEGEMDLASLVGFVDTTTVEKIDQPDEHVGGTMVVAVYYDCPEYADTMHEFIRRFENQ